MSPSHHACVHKLQMRSAVGVHVDLIAASWTAFPRIASLRVARINNHSRFLCKNRWRMHVSKSPVVESRTKEIVNEGGRVIGVAGLMPDIGVQDRNRIGRIQSRAE